MRDPPSWKRIRRSLSALVASTLVGCTTVTRVTVTPEQLGHLAGMSPGEERGVLVTDDGQTRMLLARGTDEVRLLVTPGPPPRKTEQPWVELCDLQWDSEGSVKRPAGTEELDRNGTLMLIPAAEVTGADLEMSRFSGGKTAILVVAMVVGTAVVAVAAVAVMAYAINKNIQ